MKKKIISIPISKSRISQIVPHTNFDGFSKRIVFPVTAGKFAKHVLLISDKFVVDDPYNPDRIIMKFYSDNPVKLSLPHTLPNGKIQWEQIKTTPEELKRELNGGRYVRTQQRKLYTEEEIEYLKKNVSAIEFLRAHTCHTFSQQGHNYFRCDQHNSFVIDMGKNLIYWNSIGVRGTVLDYLQKVEGKDFKESIALMKDFLNELPLEKRELNLENYNKKVEFKLPEKAKNNRRAIAYLTKQRGLPYAILKPYFDSGLIYEDTRGNVVFVCKDYNGKPVSAFLRGTYGSYKGNVAGSYKEQGFYINCCPGASKLVVTEAFIDGFSYLADKMNKGEKIDFNIIACDSCTVAFETWRLNLLNREELRDNINKVYLALDNDKAGLKAIEEFYGAAHFFPFLKFENDLPDPGMDWNVQMKRNLQKMNGGNEFDYNFNIEQQLTK